MKPLTLALLLLAIALPPPLATSQGRLKDVEPHAAFGDFSGAYHALRGLDPEEIYSNESKLAKILTRYTGIENFARTTVAKLLDSANDIPALSLIHEEIRFIASLPTKGGIGELDQQFRQRITKLLVDNKIDLYYGSPDIRLIRRGDRIQEPEAERAIFYNTLRRAQREGRLDQKRKYGEVYFSHTQLGDVLDFLTQHPEARQKALELLSLLHWPRTILTSGQLPAIYPEFCRERLSQTVLTLYLKLPGISLNTAELPKILLDSDEALVTLGDSGLPVEIRDGGFEFSGTNKETTESLTINEGHSGAWFLLLGPATSAVTSRFRHDVRKVTRSDEAVFAYEIIISPPGSSPLREVFSGKEIFEWDSCVAADSALKSDECGRLRRQTSKSEARTKILERLASRIVDLVCSVSKPK